MLTSMISFTSYTIIPDLKLILVNCQGTITFKDLIQLNLRFIADKLYDSSFDVLMDFRDSTALAFKLDVAEFFDFFKKTISLSQRVRNGILYNTPNQKFIISVYKPTASLMKVDVEAFREINEYLVWMQFSSNEQVTIKEALDSIKNKSSN